MAEPSSHETTVRVVLDDFDAFVFEQARAREGATMSDMIRSAVVHYLLSDPTFDLERLRRMAALRAHRMVDQSRRPRFEEQAKKFLDRLDRSKKRRSNFDEPSRTAVDGVGGHKSKPKDFPED